MLNEQFNIPRLRNKELDSLLVVGKADIVIVDL